MKPELFAYVSDLLKRRTGLVITQDKLYLLETRLMPLARSLGCQSLDALIDHYRSSQTEAVAVAICEAMNTHESLFFRDGQPFQMFRERIVPELTRRRAEKKHVRIWCAACSSGQEPYSLAMIVDELALLHAGWRIEIVATDISHAILKRAQSGLFSQIEVQRGMPVQMLIKHFTQEGENWRLADHIRKMVTFRHFNLLESPVSLGVFDVVLCRNVLIYFDVPTKTRVLEALAGVMAKDGVLFLGSSESTIGLTEKLWPVEAGRGVYKHTKGVACLVEKG